MKAVFQMDGPVFNSGVPMHIAIEALGDLQTIIEKSYLVYQGREKISQEERRILQIRINHLGPGSPILLAKLELVINVAQIALPLIATINPNVIWDYTKATFSFLKSVFNAAKEGQKPQYSISGNDVTVTTGTQTHVYHAPVYHIGKLVLPSYQRLSRLMEEEEITSAELFSESDVRRETPAIELHESDRDLFSIPTTVGPEPISLTCEVFDFNKYENQGRLNTFDNQDIPAGKYSFKVVGEQDVVSYIDAMLYEKVTVTCLVENRNDPLGESTVARLQVISVEHASPIAGSNG